MAFSIEDLAGKKIKKAALGWDHILILFTDKTYLKIESDIDQYEGTRECPNYELLKVNEYTDYNDLNKLGVITDEERDKRNEAHMKELREERDANDKLARKMQYERLKKEFEDEEENT